MAAALQLPDELVRLVALSNPSDSHFDNGIVELSTETCAWIRGLFAPRAWVGSNAGGDERLLRLLIVRRTDFAPKILSRPASERDLHLLGNLAETAEARQHLVTLGLVDAILNIASLDLRHRGRSFERPALLWVLHNHIYFVDRIPVELVELLCSHVGSTRNPHQYALTCLERIALRGPATTRALFSEESVEHLVRYYAGTESVRARDHVDMVSFAALSFATGNVILASKHANMSSLTSRISASVGRREELIRNERDSRRHLEYCGFLRPGESLLMYLSLCLCSDDHVARSGTLNLAIILAAVSPHAFFEDPFESVSARLYIEEAYKVKAEMDAALTGADPHVLLASMRRMRPSQGLLLADCVLRLARHNDDVVRKLARVASRRLPRRVINQIVWSPSLHQLFGKRCRRLVQAMLILCRRGDLAIPTDLCVMHVFPFACTALGV